MLSTTYISDKKYKGKLIYQLGLPPGYQLSVDPYSPAFPSKQIIAKQSLKFKPQVKCVLIIIFIISCCLSYY